MTYKKLPANTPAILRAAGLTVIEVDGWYGRGRPASTGDLNPVGVLCHHTATGPRTSNAAVVKLLVNGRKDLPGPLCHFGLRRDGVVYLIAAGRANHAGKAKKSGTVAAGDGNELYWGIEAFNDGVGEKWTATQINAYALLCAVISVKITKNSVNTVRAHKETSVTGKIDPTFNMTNFRTTVNAKMQSLSVVKPKLPVTKVPVPTPAAWNTFIHLDTSKYMDYYKAIEDAAKPGGMNAVDVDVQRSSQGTMWGLHWGVVGKNKLHDPKGKIPATARIDSLTDLQIGSLRSAAGKRPHRITELLDLAERGKVRIELELKVVFPLAKIKSLLARKTTAAMHKARRLQFKVLAQMPYAMAKLTPVDQAGGLTILSFTGYKGSGVAKSVAFPIVDYYRGTPKWS